MRAAATVERIEIMRFEDRRELNAGDVVANVYGTIRTVTEGRDDGIFWIAGALPEISAKALDSYIGPNRGLEFVHNDGLGTLLVLLDGAG